MENFNIVGKNDQTELKKLSDLPLDMEFAILAIKIVETKFGSRIMVSLKEFDILLPARFRKFGEQELSQLVGRKLIYKGINGRSSWVEFR